MEAPWNAPSFDCVLEISATRIRMMRNLGAAEGLVIRGGSAA
jgi:hypothetical protein